MPQRITAARKPDRWSGSPLARCRRRWDGGDPPAASSCIAVAVIATATTTSARTATAGRRSSRPSPMPSVAVVEHPDVAGLVAGARRQEAAALLAALFGGGGLLGLLQAPRPGRWRRPRRSGRRAAAPGGRGAGCRPASPAARRSRPGSADQRATSASALRVDVADDAGLASAHAS